MYHTHHSRHAEDLPFWLELAAVHAGPVLELGCGTGRVLVPLAQAGHRVVGLDVDPANLAFFARNLPPALAGQVQVFQADMAAFHLALRFGLAIIPCNTFSTLAPAQRQAVLRLSNWHLNPDGQLGISMPNPLLLKRMATQSDPEVEDTFLHPEDGEPVQVSSGWQRLENRFTVFWHYDHLLPDGTVQRTSARASHHIQLLEAWQQELAAAGLLLRKICGDYDGSAYTPRSPLLILLASHGCF